MSWQQESPWYLTLKKKSSIILKQFFVSTIELRIVKTTSSGAKKNAIF